MYVVDNKNNYTVAGHSGVKTVVVKYVIYTHFLNFHTYSICLTSALYQKNEFEHPAIEIRRATPIVG